MAQSEKREHACWACGVVHEGIEPKYCETCGDKLQELKTYQEALLCIRICLEGDDPDGLKDALESVPSILETNPSAVELIDQI